MKRITNKQRAKWGQDALIAHSVAREGGAELCADEMICIIDLLVDLQHLCSRGRIIDFDYCVRMAREHFEHERRPSRRAALAKVQS